MPESADAADVDMDAPASVEAAPEGDEVQDAGDKDGPTAESMEVEESTAVESAGLVTTPYLRLPQVSLKHRPTWIEYSSWIRYRYL